MEPAIGIEPITYRLQGGCSANWAKLAQKSTVGLVFKSIKCFRNSSLFSSCVSLFNHSNLSGLINSLKYFTQILNSQSSFRFNTFKKFFHSHFHSKFEIIISLCENLWSIHSFDSWLLNWHWKIQIGYKEYQLSESGTRTHDPVVNSHLLYRLSYLGFATVTNIMICDPFSRDFWLFIPLFQISSKNPLLDLDY